MVMVLKTIEVKASRGSNPFPSANVVKKLMVLVVHNTKSNRLL